MESFLDSGSARRGSLNSLNRQSSGSSFSHNSKLASPGGGINNNTTTTNLANNNNISNQHNLYKELDKFTKYFIIKSVQVIVQSRISGTSKKVRSECKPSGNDWFNINISDIVEVSERTKKALDLESGFSVRSNWRVCCEISLRTSDGGRIILEHWIISNKSYSNQQQQQQGGGQLLSMKLGGSNHQNQAAPKSPQSSRLSPVQSPFSNNNNNNGNSSPLSAINTTPTRLRTATFSNTMRTRLNSIDDCSGGDKSYLTKKLVGTNNENLDIKFSTSCYSLSNSPANQTTDQNTAITPSPSINSLTNNNPTQQSSNNSYAANNNLSSQQQQQQHQQQGSKSNSVSSIYTIYNKMSLLLKTLATTTHIVPAYRLASRTSNADSCVICYRVYTCPSSYQPTKGNPITNRNSIEDINYNLNNLDSPNKRSTSSNSSYGSLNIRDLVGPDELEHFCPIFKLGSIKTEVNELEVSVCYRTDVKNSNQLLKSPRLKDMYNKIVDEDCIIAAKQLLAGNEHLKNNNNNQLDDSINDDDDSQCLEALSYIDRPLRPAFATRESKPEDNPVDPNLELVESAFDGLLKINNHEVQDEVDATGNLTNKNNLTNTDGRSTNAQSEPIQVPNASSTRAKYQGLYLNLSSGSTPKSLTDSFVFVDLNPPFASEDQNDINSFFHGPSPAFSNGFDSLKDVDELTNQLANIEADADQFDEFVDNICMSQEEEEDDNN